MRAIAISLLCAAAVLAADPPSDLIEKQFRQLDKNGDGKLSPEELKASPSFAKLLEGAEKDKDGNLTLDAVRTYLGTRIVTRDLSNSASPTLSVRIRQFWSSKLIGRDPRPGSILEPVRAGPALRKPAEAGVGRQAPDISFTDINGKAGRLSDLKDQKGVVVAFTSTSCPVSKKYAPVLTRLEKTYRDKDVAFVFVNPIASDSVEGVKALGFIGPYVHDSAGAFAGEMGANVTTDVFLLDSARTVIYRGAVDDQYGEGYSHDEPTRTYLASAIDSLLANKPPVIAATEASGCALDFRKASARTSLTYYRDISRLVQSHCIECHRKNGAAPFSLETYKDVVAHAGEIKRVVDKGIMPPWFAAPPKEGPTPWANDHSLTKNEKEELLGWLNGDRAEGEKADAPVPRTFDPGWQIGKPDLVVRPAKPFKVKAEGTMPYQNVLVETNLEEDKWVQALEVRPSAKQVVHHVLVFVIEKRDLKVASLVDQFTQNEGLTYYAIYAPGRSAVIYPDGFGKRLPKGAKVHFQIHYTPNGTATEDTTELGVIYAKEKPKIEVRVLSLVNPTFAIPPGADSHEVRATQKLPFNAKILGFMPHMHFRGKAFRYEVIEPGGKPEMLLDVPRYDFNWQLLYSYAEPRGVPRGSTLKATAWFDNSAKNPANPDPTKTVRWGLQTFDEMMLGYVEFYIP
jgi:thiol-disulfide isomerase/thioredoxin